MMLGRSSTLTDVIKNGNQGTPCISYGKSFKKFVGGGVVVACLIIVSLQVLESDLELDNRDNVIQKHDPQK